MNFKKLKIKAVGKKLDKKIKTPAKKKLKPFVFKKK